LLIALSKPAALASTTAVIFGDLLGVQVSSIVNPDSQYIIIPIVDHFPNGRKDVTVVGFLQFIITYLNGSTVKGTLINYALVSGDSEIGPVNNTGFRSTRMIK